MTGSEPASTGALVQQVAREANRPTRAAVVIAALTFLVVVGLAWRVLDRLDQAEKRERAVAAVVAAFAELATADTQAEQQAALDKIAEARKELPQDSPVRRELESTTTTTSGGSSGAPAPSSTETAAPPPATTGTTKVASTTTTTAAVLIDLPPLDLPPIDPVPVPCVPFVCSLLQEES